MFTRISAFLLGGALSFSAWCADLPVAENLLRDGADATRSGKPIVALVSATGCHYCDLLKDNVFVGMERDPRIILREFAMDNPLELIDFDGKATVHPDFTGKYGVFLTPTVLFLDGAGQPLAEPIVGVSNIDFYLYYLERRISQSRLKLSD